MPNRPNMRKLIPTALTLICMLSLPLNLAAQSVNTMRDEIPSIEQRTAGMEAMTGFFNLYWEESTGKLFWEIDKWEEEFLYAVSLTSGLGSNPVGLDRGQLGSSIILKARKVGPKVLLIQPNYRYRARSDNPLEVQAVEDAFAPSTQWGFDVAAQTGERVLVDATDFFLRDTHGAALRMQRSGQGNFQLDRSRSVFHLPGTKVFPRNCEVETWLTFTSDNPGPQVRSTAASGKAVSLKQHHSIVELPGPGYTPRVADPRVNSGSITFSDYATPIDEDLQINWVRRHRIKKLNPGSRRSVPVEPVVYYIDPGAPEPIYTALKEGAQWWNEAFEAAGFINGFQVRDLPEGADPMDLRYNMIHWTHRSTRGWSYGGSVVDPRTGEIIKGNVNLGSLRLRQDILLGEGLEPFYPSDGSATALRPVSEMTLADGPTFDYLAAVAPDTDPVELALSRVRQLSSHEVGHTLGFAHNYVTSAYGRSSVMDYPAPLVRIDRYGELDLSDAYAEGAGEFDIFAVRWAYTDFGPDADEDAELEKIIKDALSRGIRFATDSEARPLGAAHPKAALWDNGADPVDYLRHEMEVRRIGLESFGEYNIREGEPLASLEELLVPLYLHHRYQMEAAAHSLGGADYTYALRGDGQTPIEIVPGDKQIATLVLLLSTIEPEFLMLPDRILDLIPPRAFGMNSGETFSSRTSPILDPIGMAATAADMTVRLILQPQRMARLVDFHSRDESNPGLHQVVDMLLEATWFADPPGDYLGTRQGAIKAAVDYGVLERMKREAGNTSNPPQVRGILLEKLHELRTWLEALEEQSPHQRLAQEGIKRWIERPEGLDGPSVVPAAPPGSPIGIPPLPPSV